MRLDPFKRFALALAVAGSVASCDAAVAPPPPVAVALGAGYWYLNTVDDSVLGSTIASRILGVVQERTVVDSGSLLINVDGSFEQRYWVRVFVSDALDRSETVIDIGNWVATANDYAFVSTVRHRSFSVRALSLTRISTEEPMVFFQDPPLTVGIYRRTRP